MRNLPYASYYILTWNLATVRSQYLVRLLSFCWIKEGPTIHQPIKGLLLPAGTEPTPLLNLAFKTTGLQVHATTRVA